MAQHILSRLTAGLDISLIYNKAIKFVKEGNIEEDIVDDYEVSGDCILIKGTNNDYSFDISKIECTNMNQHVRFDFANMVNTWIMI